MKTKAERIAALIADPKSPFSDAEKAQLEALTEEQLTALEGQTREARMAALFASITVVKPETKKEEKLETKVETKNAEAKKPATVDEALEGMPTEIASVIRSAMATEKATKAAVIKVLVDSKRCDISAGDLEKKDIKELQALVKLAGIEVKNAAHVDYSGQGAPRVNDGDKPAAPPAPDFAAALKARRAAGK